MTEAPAKIWASPSEAEYLKLLGEADDEDSIPYIRADIAQELAGALRIAAGTLHSGSLDFDDAIAVKAAIQRAKEAGL